jgi:hypothetical protein
LFVVVVVVVVYMKGFGDWRSFDFGLSPLIADVVVVVVDDED